MKDKPEEEILEAEEYFREFLFVIKQMTDRIQIGKNPDIEEGLDQED